MVTEGNAQSRRDHERHEKGDLKRLQPVVPNVGRDAEHSRRECSDQKDAVGPANFFPGKLHRAILCLPGRFNAGGVSNLVGADQ